MIDLEGRVASWNSGAQHLLGYSSEEILGQSAATFFGSQGHTDVLEREMREAQMTGRATSTGWRVRKNADHLYVEGSLTAVRDDFGRLLGYSKLMRDITDRRRIEVEREHLLQSERAARSEAERSSRMKDEFLATLGPRAAHAAERDPRLVAGAAAGCGASAEIAEGSKVIERNARAQAQIIEDLLDMSRIISGKVRLDMQQGRPRLDRRGRGQAVRPAAEAKGIALELDVDAGAATSAATRTVCSRCSGTC